VDEEPRAAKHDVEVLALAQSAGRFGLFEWNIPIDTVDLSDHFLKLYGLTEFDGRYGSWLACIFREDRVRVSNLIETALSEGVTALNFEFRIAGAGDRALKWIEARNVITYDDAQKPRRMVGVNVDVSEQKRANVQMRAFTETLEDRVRERTRELEAEFAARQKVEESLRQTQKMEAVGQLTGGIAHDFNNILTVVLGGLEVIGRLLPSLQDSPSVARIRKARDMSVKGVHNAARLIDRLMAFSRLQPLAPTAVNANKLVADISELLLRTLGETVSLETVLAGGLWNCFADANQLENAVLNLALNARDAMPDGGKLTIETANAHLDEAYVATLSEKVAPGQYVLLAISDAGSGMTPQTAERAIEPFFTTKEVGKGTGLGLSQVYGFVRQSSGHIRIYSELGEGTTVRIYLPRYVGYSPVLQLPSALLAADAPRAIGNKCVLVVEDDEVLRAHAVEILRELGYRVLHAANGADALAALAAPDNRIDLLFTDVVMPGGMNGRQLADEAVARKPALKVLFTTGYTKNAIVHHGRLDAGTQLLTKPYSFSELAQKVRAALDI
jgi:signal transduction histidine kinase